MYLVAFGVAYLIFNYERKKGMTIISNDDTIDLFIWTIGFLLLGARLGSVFIYDDNRLEYLLKPWLIFWPFQNGQFVGLPGMSFHGGVIGVVTGILLFCRSTRKRARRKFVQDAARFGEKKALRRNQENKGFTFFDISDPLLLAVPLGYMFGRLGNFINAELYGRVTDSSLGMLFPGAQELSTSIPWVAEMATRLGIEFTAGAYVNLPRWPSQLIEGIFEGVVTFLILWFVIRPYAVRKQRPNGLVTGWYLILYGTFRFFIEYLREPDENLGYILSIGGNKGPIELFESVWNFSMGQLLCTLMIISGILVIFFTGRRTVNGKE